MSETRSGTTEAASVRPVLQAIARMIAADRRPVVLATRKGEVLLANTPATRLGLDETALRKTFDWGSLCTRAHRAGSIAASAPREGGDLEGEVVHIPLGQADGFLLRLAETDQEATMLRNRTRTATLMRVAHDLRTPIQSLLATSEAVFAEMNGDTAATSPARAGMQRAAKQTLDHIDNVLKVIRGESSASDLQLDEDFNLGAEFGAIIELIEPIANARGAALHTAQEPQGDIRAHGPVRFVRALLQNVIDNSAKHGGDRIDVRLECTPLADSEAGISVLVEVADLGGGLPEAQKARLRRVLGHPAPHGTNRAAMAQGTGGRTSAGLNVMAHALRQLGGHMEVLDRGSDGAPVTDGGKVVGTILRARFSLTAAVGDAPAATAAVAEAPVALDKLGILVVEDSPASRDWLVHTLTAAGADVLAVGNGVKALEILKQKDAPQRFELLLSDMTLPYMSGVELVRRVIAAQSAGTLEWRGKMLGLTAHVDEALRTACLDLGMARVLEKPIRSGHLCEAIQKTMQDGPATAEPEAPKPACPPGQDQSPLDRDALDELIGQLGVDGTQGFMQRALAEAQAACKDIEANGIREDTGRMLHAATGACGLTGLTLAERSLRRVELCLGSPDADMPAAMSDLQRALADTRDAIDAMTSDTGAACSRSSPC